MAIKRCSSESMAAFRTRIVTTSNFLTQANISTLRLRSHVSLSPSLVPFFPTFLVSSIFTFPPPFDGNHIKPHLHHLTQSFSSFITRSCDYQHILNTIFRNTSDSCSLEFSVSKFNSILEPNTFSWNSIIKAHVDSGLFDAAFELYQRMRQSSIRPDNFTFPMVNRAVSTLPDGLRRGEQNHCLGFQMGFGNDVYCCNTLVEMYARCGRIDCARQMFDEMLQRDLVSWILMVSCYMRCGNFFRSFELFHEMRVAEFEPNSVAIVVMLQACSASGDVVQGQKFHCYGIKKGFERYESVKNSILTMYNKTGCFQDGENLFKMIDVRDVVSWNIMISSYSLNGDLSKVIKAFDEMRRLDVIPSIETLTLLISTFANFGDRLQGEKLHSYAVKSGLTDMFWQTALVDFYAKCGELEISTQLFEEIGGKNSVSWGVMMSGFIQNGYSVEAIELFRRMQNLDLKPTVEMLRGIVLAYAHLGALQLGKGVHGYAIRNGFYNVKDNTSMETSVLNMYVKCGSIDNARKCFDHMDAKDIVSWTSMMDGYGIHGLGLEALKLSDQMELEGIKPNSVTFLSLLSACSHSGLLNEGCQVFNQMAGNFGTKPDLNHYTCLVDLLGRSGRLKEALQIIQNMAVKPDSRIWGALLASCRTYSNSELGLYAAQQVLDLEPLNAGYHIVLSNVHASGEKWDGAENVRKMMSEKDLKKKPGWSCIETRGELHGFVAGDCSHPHAIEIYGMLGCLAKNMAEGGLIFA